MAIKVNGTTVINDSRALSNIASVDATTVAAMAAAGVGGGKNNVLSLVQDTSGTFTVPFNCTMVIQLIGAGGSGARKANYYGTNRTVLATGGASGGVAIKKVSATAGQTFTVTVGSGGTTSNNTLYNTGENGNAGGNSTVTGTGVSMTANGGGSGLYYDSGTYDGTKTLTSNAGGSASGGDTNLTGNTSTAKVGFDTGSLAVGCSSGAAAGRAGAVTDVNTKYRLNFTTGQINYETAVTIGAASDVKNGPFDYYQTETSTGSPAMWFLATVGGSGRDVKNKTTGGGIPDGWLGKYGGGSGASFISAYGSNFSVDMQAGENFVKGGDGVCIFTMFLDL